MSDPRLTSDLLLLFGSAGNIPLWFKSSPSQDHWQRENPSGVGIVKSKLLVMVGNIMSYNQSSMWGLSRHLQLLSVAFVTKNPLCSLHSQLLCSALVGS